MADVVVPASIPQTQKRRPFWGRRFVFLDREEEFFCPLQAWQRPTLPGLKP